MEKVNELNWIGWIIFGMYETGFQVCLPCLIVFLFSLIKLIFIISLATLISRKTAIES